MPAGGGELAGGAPAGIRAVPDVLVDAALSTEGDAGALARADYVAKVALVGGGGGRHAAARDGRVGVLVGQNGRLGLAGLGDLSAPQGALWTWAEALGDELARGPACA